MINDGQTFAPSYFKKEDTKDEVFSFSSRFGGPFLPSSCTPPASTLLLVSAHPSLPTAGTLVLHLQCD